MFGAKNRRAREIAHEVLKPLGVDVKDLTDQSADAVMTHMRRIVGQDRDDELYRRQDGWRQGDR